MPSGGMSTSLGSDRWGLARQYAAPFWRTFGLVLAVTSIPTFAGANADEPAAGRQKEILHLLKHDCGSCHGMTLKGGLGPSLLPAAIREASDEALVETIMNGRPGTPMAPWRISLDENEAGWLVGRLKEGFDDAE
ncbi:MAG: c-type cytochrome [Geminicoccales bacterium]